MAPRFPPARSPTEELCPLLPPPTSHAQQDEGAHKGTKRREGDGMGWKGGKWSGGEGKGKERKGPGSICGTQGASGWAAFIGSAHPHRWHRPVPLCPSPHSGDAGCGSSSAPLLPAPCLRPAPSPHRHRRSVPSCGTRGAAPALGGVGGGEEGGTAPPWGCGPVGSAGPSLLLLLLLVGLLAGEETELGGGRGGVRWGEKEEREGMRGEGWGEGGRMREGERGRKDGEEWRKGEDGGGRNGGGDAGVRRGRGRGEGEDEGRRRSRARTGGEGEGGSGDHAPPARPPTHLPQTDADGRQQQQPPQRAAHQDPERHGHAPLPQHLQHRLWNGRRPWWGEGGGRLPQPQPSSPRPPAPRAPPSRYPPPPGAPHPSTSHPGISLPPELPSSPCLPPPVPPRFPHLAPTRALIQQQHCAARRAQRRGADDPHAAERRLHGAERTRGSQSTTPPNRVPLCGGARGVSRPPSPLGRSRCAPLGGRERRRRGPAAAAPRRSSAPGTTRCCSPMGARRWGRGHGSPPPPPRCPNPHQPPSPSSPRAADPRDARPSRCCWGGRAAHTWPGDVRGGLGGVSAQRRAAGPLSRPLPLPFPPPALAHVLRPHSGDRQERNAAVAQGRQRQAQRHVPHREAAQVLHLGGGGDRALGEILLPPPP